MRILCDMDGVVADINDHWLNIINRYYGEKLTIDQITSWDLASFCEQATPDQVYGHLKDPGFFLHLEPIDNALWGINSLLEAGHDVIFVSSCRHGHSDKRAWIKNHLPKFNRKNIIFAERKELVQGDILIDDYDGNLAAWWYANPKGLPICFSQPYNAHYTECPRAESWDDVLRLVDKKQSAMAGLAGRRA